MWRVLRPAARVGVRVGVPGKRQHLVRSYQTAFLFPGQGAQAVGMSEVTGTTDASVVREVKDLYGVASSILGYDLLDLCLHGPTETINSTKVAQVAIFVNSMAALVKLRHENPEVIGNCSVAMGLSLGEYSALCFAGAFSFEDGVRLTKARGEAMQEASDLRQGGMVAITGLDEEDLLKLCDDSKVIAATQDRDNFDTELYLGIGNYLSDKHFTVSGDISACIALQEAALLRQEVKVVKLLAVSGAFHTPLMSPAQHALSAILEETSFTPETMSCPVYSNVTGDSYYYHDSTSHDIKTALLVQLVQPVMWNKSMSLLLSHPSFQQAYEVGPGSVCSGIVKAHNRRAKVKPYKL